MSIDVNWATATSGPDGEALAERIRSFIHDKFQQVPLPRFIRSVNVHSFDFGTIAPDLEIKDFCEPFSDFYEEDDDETSEISEGLGSGHGSPWQTTHSELNEPPFRDEMQLNQPLRDPFDEDHHHFHHHSALRSPMALGDHLNPHFLPRAGTPGIPGGTSTLGYHLMSLGGLSGTQTPLAAVAGGSPFVPGWTDSQGANHYYNNTHNIPRGRPSAPLGDVDSSNPTSRPSTASTHPSGSNRNSGDAAIGTDHGSHPDEHHHHPRNKHLDDPTSVEGQPFQIPPRMRERRPEDFQVLCHAKYSGDVRLSLTAEILLDYPMPSFVGLPLKLNVTGITFDGVAVVAYIRKRIHFCFLAPEDADALVGPDQRDGAAAGGGSGPDDHPPRSVVDPPTSPKQQGGLLREIRVESEIGRKEDGKQVLKNVGKVERFVLAQVRRIFEEELVYPSFYTFLI